MTQLRSPAPLGGPPQEQPPAPRVRVEPARRLSPDPRPDGPWRVLSAILGALVVVGVVVTMALASLVPWSLDRSLAEVPATRSAGSPASLQVTTDAADVRVQRSDQAQEVSISLVPSGSTVPPAADERVRADVRVTGTAQDPVLDISQGFQGSVLPWGDAGRRDVLIVIPSDLEIPVDLRTSVGDVDVDGGFASLTARSDAGMVRAADISAPGGVRLDSGVGGVQLAMASAEETAVDVRSPLGDVDVRLAPDATGALSISSDVGDVDVRVPGGARWEVEASSESGTSRIDPGVRASGAAAEGRMTISSGLGDVTVAR